MTRSSIEVSEESRALIGQIQKAQDTPASRSKICEVALRQGLVHLASSRTDPVRDASAQPEPSKLSREQLGDMLAQSMEPVLLRKAELRRKSEGLSWFDVFTQGLDRWVAGDLQESSIEQRVEDLTEEIMPQYLGLLRVAREQDGLNWQQVFRKGMKSWLIARPPSRKRI